MRIDRLDLLAYGLFTEHSLDLSDGDFGLHVIYGNNEAGKSTSLRALIAWLFGVPARTTDNFVHENPQLRIGGRLRHLDGQTLEFSRKKGNKNTLLKYGTNDPLDDDVLIPFLPAGIDGNVFTKLWGIDHERLIAGGHELLEDSGDLGHALFSAAVGTAHLREILLALQDRADELFKPRGSKAFVNQAVAAFKDAQKRMKEASLPVSDWKKLHDDLGKMNADIGGIDEEIQAKGTVKNRLERVYRVKEALARYRQILERIAELDQVDLLPESFEETRKSALATLQKTLEIKERLDAKLLRLTDELNACDVRADLIENEAAILDLYKKLGAVEKALSDRPQQDGKRRLLRNDAESLLKRVLPEAGLDQADHLRPLLNNKKLIFDLAQKNSLLLQKKEQIETKLRDAEDEKKALQTELESKLESDLDLETLKATIASTRRAGDVEQRLEEARAQAQTEDEGCRKALKRLGRYTGSIESVLELSVPIAETLDAFEKENDTLLEASKDAGRKKQTFEKEKKQAEQDLKKLLRQGDVPSLVDLETSRADRNVGWQLIKRKYIERADVGNELSRYAPESDLPSVYEIKVDQADQLSDDLRRDADHVLKRVELESKIESLCLQISDLQETLERLQTEADDFQTRWSAIWEPLSVIAGTPKEMKQWRVGMDTLVERIQGARGVVANKNNLVAEHDRLRNTIARLVAKIDSSIEVSAMSLEALISLCEQRVETEETIRVKRRQIEDALSQSEIHIKRIQDERKSVDAERTRWESEWSQAIHGLGLKADALPELATQTFENLELFFKKYDQSEDERKRIFGIDQVKEAFEKKVFAFADSIGLNHEGQDALLIAAQLNNDLATARESRASVVQIKAQLKENKQERADAEITIKHSGEQLAALRTQAKVETDDELVAAGEYSRNKRELQKSLEALEQELSRTGDGLSIDQLEEESEAVEVDAIASELEKVSEAMTELQETRDALRDQRQSIRNEIEAKDGSAEAANASDEAEEYLASIASHSEQYLRLQIAILILEQRIENYRKLNQAPVLARAGELFSTLTLGSYAGLYDELDHAGKPILLGVRPDDKEVPVEGMSEGSRDQLYLALRLATLEQHLSKGEPMPFVVDDILIGFDDDRTRVCLEVLAELATKTQVLLFTHHRRVLELAEKVEGEAGVFIHELP